MYIPEELELLITAHKRLDEPVGWDNKKAAMLMLQSCGMSKVSAAMVTWG